MKSATHADNRNASEHTEDQLAGMSLYGWFGKVRNVLKGHTFFDLNLIAQQSQSRPTNNSKFRGKVGQSDGVCDLSCSFVAESEITKSLLDWTFN